MMSERLVTLADGKQVPSHHECWRMECEARHILNLPKEQRQPYIDNCAKQRGQQAAQELREATIKLHQLKRNHQRKQSHE